MFSSSVCVKKKSKNKIKKSPEKWDDSCGGLFHHLQSSSTVGVIVTPLLICPQPIRLNGEGRKKKKENDVGESKKLLYFLGNFLRSGFSILGQIFKVFFFLGLSSLPPMFLHSSTQSDLLSHFRTYRVGQDNLGQIGLDSTDTTSCGQWSDVDHQHFILRQFLDLRVLRKKEWGYIMSLWALSSLL